MEPVDVAAVEEPEAVGAYEEGRGVGFPSVVVFGEVYWGPGAESLEWIVFGVGAEEFGGCGRGCGGVPFCAVAFFS